MFSKAAPQAGASARDSINIKHNVYDVYVKIDLEVDTMEPLFGAPRLRTGPRCVSLLSAAATNTALILRCPPKHLRRRASKDGRELRVHALVLRGSPKRASTSG